ncbi:MAG TPA: SusC/RagA family TonB-linked outer membrane protein, partial [Balneolaceae bacterium]|nr:SusC/RagA family TonB-linked outer membrane protein [Balneolaceae bacterium]
MTQNTVSGTVIDAETLDPLPGVNIVVKGQPTVGTATNLDGEYSFDVPSLQDTLIFSFIGFLRQEVPIQGRTTIDIELEPDVQTLEGVVVIGYGVQQKEDNTGSVNVINTRDFNQGNVTSAQELFQGKVAGVNVTSGDGAPGSRPEVRIRGGSSLSASNAPLYVIDGVPLSDDGIAGSRDPLNSINPNDIESISVLKDASATAIYGSRASGGVIIITTKKGRKGQPTRINYNFKASLNTNHKQVDVLSADQLRTIISEEFDESALERLGDQNTDWQDQIFDNSISQDHNISVTGSMDQIGLPYRLSVGFTGSNGILERSSLDRLTTSVALNPTFFDERLKVDINLKGVREDNFFSAESAIGEAIRFDPTQPVRPGDPGDRFDGFFAWTDSQGNPITIAPANPVARIQQTSDNAVVFRGIGNVQLDLEVPRVEGLHANLNLGFDYSDVGTGDFRVPGSAAFADDGSNAVGVRRDFDQTRENEVLEFYMKYDKELPRANSRFDITAGYSWERNYETSETFETNFNIDDVLQVEQDIDFITERFLVSAFGRINYSFMDKYLLTGTIRRDGTSRFSSENRWGLFPSVALAWKIHEEGFLAN